ncbi:hypothetical protein GCM10028786_34530 [Flaviaesturariibacter terrae]
MALYWSLNYRQRSIDPATAGRFGPAVANLLSYPILRIVAGVKKASSNEEAFPFFNACGKFRCGYYLFIGK